MQGHHDYNANYGLGPARVDARQVNGGVGNRAPDFADQYVGGSFTPGSSAHQRTERVRIGLLDLVYENWIPFTAWITARFIPPRRPTAAFQSPYDLDAGERITRQGSYPSGERPYPYPYVIGAVSGFMPMLDTLSMTFAWGKTPSGPGTLTPVPVPFDIQYPGLSKVTG